MNQKHQPSIYDKNVNADLMEQNVIQINGGVTINDGGSVKSIIYVKKIMFGILLHVTVKMENIQQALWMIQQLSVMKLQSYDEEINFNESKAICKTDFYILLAF